MRRNYSPFDGCRYILNTNTGVAHDLDNEDVNCQIDEINPEHIVATDIFGLVIKYHSKYKEMCDYCMEKDG